MTSDARDIQQRKKFDFNGIPHALVVSTDCVGKLALSLRELPKQFQLRSSFSKTR